MPILRYLNVDLDIVSKVEPAKLLKALGGRVCVLYSGKTRGQWLTCLEQSRYYRTPGKALAGWIRLLEKMPAAAKRELKNSKMKTFDAGFDVAAGSKCHRLALGEDELRALAKWGARHVVTLYEADTTEPGGGVLDPKAT